jgi:hypothetical protein
MSMARRKSRLPLILDVLECLTVHLGYAAIGAAPSVGFVQDIFPAHLVPETVEPRGCFALGFRL